MAYAVTMGHEAPSLKVKVKVTLPPTVSRPVHLGVRRPSGTRDQFFFLLGILFRQLRVCYSVVPSLTRGRVCNLLLLLVLASAVPLGSAISDERSGLSFASIILQSVSTYIRYLHKIFTLCVYTVHRSDDMMLYRASTNLPTFQRNLLPPSSGWKKQTE
jgi:hypothetical protein